MITFNQPSQTKPHGITDLATNPRAIPSPPSPGELRSCDHLCMHKPRCTRCIYYINVCICVYIYKYVNVQTDHVGTVYKSCNAMNTTLTTTKTSVVHIWETILVPVIQDMSISRRCILTFGRIPSWVLDESTHLLQCYPQLWAEWYHQYPNTAERGEPI